MNTQMQAPSSVWSCKHWSSVPGQKVSSLTQRNGGHAGFIVVDVVVGSGVPAAEAAVLTL
jgi:hypothetical protein